MRYSTSPGEMWIYTPALDGIKVAERLQETGCRAKIVFLTVHDDADFARAALATGALGYVVKPRLVSESGKGSGRAPDMDLSGPGFFPAGAWLELLAIR